MPLLESARRFLRRAAPLPKFLSLDPVALDLTDKAVRVLRLERDRGFLVPGFAMEVCVEGDLAAAPPPEAPRVPGAPPLARRAVCTTLAEALSTAAASCGAEHVVSSIPERKTYIFTAALPVEAMPTLGSALEFKVQENVPLPPEAVAFDYEIIGEPRGGEIEVAVTAVPRSEIESWLSLLSAAGLTPLAFDTEARALARALVPRGDDVPHLILNLDRETTTAVVVERGVAQLSSIIALPGGKACDPATGEARELKEEVNKLLVYWFTGHAERMRPKVEDAIIAGPCADSPGLVDFLARGLQLRVRPGNAWENCFPLGSAVPEVPRSHSFAFAAAAGLALLSVE